MRRYVGIDWASQAHAVCVIDDQGAVVDRFEVSHDAKGLAELRRRLARLGSPAERAADAKAEAVRALVAVLEPLVAQIARLTSAVEHAVATLPTGRVLMSFPRAGRVCAAQITAELGDDPARFVSEDHMAAEAGVAPVTKASGKHHAVVFRWACNHRLRQALTCLADNSRHESPWATSVYQRARARGCDHPHATRILARAWVRVVYRCWTDGPPYDPALHHAAKELNIAV